MVTAPPASPSFESPLPDGIRELYPFSHHWFTLQDGERLHYVDEGEGTPVVFLHGNPTWSFMYREVIRALRRQYRCLALDHLGCGLSDKPTGYPYNLSNHIRNLGYWLEDRLGSERYHLVVHDWGGPIGFGMALQHPERLRSLTVMNSAAFTFPQLPKRIAQCRLPVWGPLAVRGLNGFVRAATRWTTVQPLSAPVRAGYLWPYQSWSDRVAILRFVQDIPMKAQHPSWTKLQEIERFLPNLGSVPLQIIWGRRDWCFTPGVLERWTAKFPKADVTVCPDAAHLVMEDAPATVTERLQAFLGPR